MADSGVTATPAWETLGAPPYTSAQEVMADRGTAGFSRERDSEPELSPVYATGKAGASDEPAPVSKFLAHVANPAILPFERPEIERFAPGFI
ncbi:hypothetical protein [Spirosoma agri]|uniref:Uncharacterized protein n=1 Tax=Spirosoma agri TaxID=1987381 RepID=A0A6M0ILN9_9BACT|nr:hypothetical protein [Spirosoma agri]NEU68321.1 hypothetical protein [Spirosoma agri]